jgi:hypothetical protein
LQGFLAIFIALGFFPALTFALFGLSVIATIGGSALVFTLFTCLSIISGAGEYPVRLLRHLLRPRAG